MKQHYTHLHSFPTFEALTEKVEQALLTFTHTGWSQRLVVDREVPPHVDHVLSKPPRLRELREILARL